MPCPHPLGEITPKMLGLALAIAFLTVLVVAIIAMVGVGGVFYLCLHK